MLVADHNIPLEQRTWNKISSGKKHKTTKKQQNTQNHKNHERSLSERVITRTPQPHAFPYSPYSTRPRAAPLDIQTPRAARSFALV